MIGPDRLARVTAAAVVPEQVVGYVSAVAGLQARMFGDCVGYLAGTEVVLIGYPLHDPIDRVAMAVAVDQALQTPGLERITVIGATRPSQVPETIESAQDSYYWLPLPPPAPGPKLKSLLRRAEREVRLSCGRRYEPDHAALVQRYIDERLLSAGTRRIFGRLGDYLETSAGSLIVSARRADGRLAAFAVLQEARQRGQSRMNLGLGVSDGIRFFKRKWGAEPFLPYVETNWQPFGPGLFSRLKGVLGRIR
jgi:hypothetical protein